ncbi:hypothetical protein NN561_016004 [Cricetulus griseus]
MLVGVSTSPQPTRTAALQPVGPPNCSSQGDSQLREGRVGQARHQHREGQAVRGRVRNTGKQAGQAQGAVASATQRFPGTQLRLQGSVPALSSPLSQPSSRRSSTPHKGLFPAEQRLHLHSSSSDNELARRAAVVIEGKVHPPRRQQGALDRKAAGKAGAGVRGQHAQDPPPSQDPPPAANWTLPTGSPAPNTDQPGDPSPYLVKVHQVWAVKAGGLKKDSLLTVRLDTWGHPSFLSCGRLKEDSRYIFFMEPDANSSGRAPPAFRASYPPLETGRNLKKEVSRVLCKRCGKCLASPWGRPLGSFRRLQGAGAPRS